VIGKYMPIIKLITQYNPSDCNPLTSIDWSASLWTNVCDHSTNQVFINVFPEVINSCSHDVDITYYYDYLEDLDNDGIFTLSETSDPISRTLIPGDNTWQDPTDSVYGPWGTPNITGEWPIQLIAHITYPGPIMYDYVFYTDLRTPC
jgi:hypothetical protein